MKLRDFKNELLLDQDFYKEYHSRDLVFDMSTMIARARIARGLTQEHLAKLMGTKQSSIARIENGASVPSLRFLEKIADALNMRLVYPKFEALEQSLITYYCADAGNMATLEKPAPTNATFQSFT